jgi:hypothetical protein
MSKLLFLIGCVPTRLLLTYLAYYLENSPLKNIVGLLTMVIGLGFLTIYFKDLRKTGVETEGRPIWWNNLRPVHGSLYILFSVLYLTGVKNSWIILLIDVIVGLIAFINNYYNK